RRVVQARGISAFVSRRRVFPGARRRALRSAVPRRDPDPFHDRGRLPLPRPAAGLALRLFDLSGELGVDVFLGEWANLLIRWAHLIVSIGWIGTSFYFMALDYS